MARNRGAQALAEPPEPDPAPAPEPRPIRVRSRTPGWRAKMRTALRVGAWLLAGAALGGALLGLRRFLLEDPRFRLPATEWEADGRALVIQGVRCTPRSEVLAVFRPDLGRSIYAVSLGERRRRLLAIDWVADATVMRRWPNRLEVRIRERQPVAFVVNDAAGQGSGQPALVDAEGVWLRWPAQGRFALPVLWGVHPEQSRELRRDRVQLMLHVLQQARERGAQISEVDLSNPENVIVTQVYEGRALRLMLGRENLGARLKAFLDYYPQIARWAPEARSFDLRVDGQVRVADPPGGAAPARSGEAGGKGAGRGR